MLLRQHRKQLHHFFTQLIYFTHKMRPNNALSS